MAIHLRALAKLTGQTQVTSGLVTHGRPETRKAQLAMGMFVNTLPISVTLNGGSWKHFVNEIFNYERVFWPHRHFPGSEIQSLLGDTPIFSSIFNFTRFAHHVARPELLERRVTETTNYPFVVQAALDEDARASLELHVAGEGTNHFENITAVYYAELQSLLTEETYASFLNEQEGAILGNACDLPFDEKAEDLFSSFQNVVNESPERIAITFEGRNLTYRELLQRAQQVASALHQRGVGHGDNVGLHMDHCPDLVAAMLGVLRVGAAYVPLDPTHPKDRLQYICEHADLTAVVVNNQTRPCHPHNQDSVINVAELSSADVIPETNVLPDSAAYMIYTSGTTGRPKGIRVSHHNVLRLFRASDEIYKFSSDYVWLLYHSFGFDVSVWETWGALLHGARLVIEPREKLKEPKYLMEVIERESISFLNQTPTAFYAFLPYLSKCDSSPIRYIVFAGEALDFERLQPFFESELKKETRLFNMYGITETTVHVTCTEVTQEDFYKGFCQIGAPIADLDLTIRDESGNLSGIGALAEIHVGGPGVTIGYHGDARQTAERFRPHASLSGARAYVSGDQARHHGEDVLEYIGRIDNQIQLRGFRIEVGEIEATIAGTDHVLDAAVILQEDGATRYLVGFYVPEHATIEESTSEDIVHLIQSRVQDRLPHYMHPARYIEIDAIPRTVNGKLDRKALSARESSHKAAFVQPETPREIEIANIMQAVLKIDSVGRHDNFIDLGGDSILSIQVVARCADQGIDISIEQLFSEMSVAELAHPDAQRASDTTRFLTQVQQRYLESIHPFRELKVEEPCSESELEILLSAIIDQHPQLDTTFEVTAGVWRPLEQGVGTHAIMSMIGGLAELYQDGPQRYGLYAVYEEGVCHTLHVHAALVDRRGSHQLAKEFLANLKSLRANQIVRPEANEVVRDWESAKLLVHNDPTKLRIERYWQERVNRIADLTQKATEQRSRDYSFDGVLKSATVTLLTAKGPKLFACDINELILTAMICAYGTVFDREEQAILITKDFRHTSADPHSSQAAIGYFEYQFPVSIQPSKSVLDSIYRTKDVMRLVPEIGLGYEALADKPNTDFYAISMDTTGFRDAPTQFRQAFVELEIDQQSHEIHYRVSLGANDLIVRHAKEIQQEFERNLIEVISLCEETPAGKLTVGNFPESLLTQTDIDRISSKHANVVDLYPASFAQQGMIFHSGLEKSQTQYHDLVIQKINLPFDASLLRLALALVSENQPILRTMFDVATGHQVVLDHVEIPIEVTDLTAVDASGSDREIDEWIAAQRTEGFDLTQTPLFRAQVFVLSANKFVLGFSFHHAILDGWSVVCLTRALLDVYQNKALHASLSVSPDIIRQHISLESAQIADENSKAFWTQTIQDCEPTVLPSTNTESGSAPIKRHALTFDTHSAQTLMHYHRELGVPLKQILQALHVVALSHLTGRSSVVTGVVTNGRPETEEGTQALGMFLNTLPLQVSLSGGTWSQLVQQLFEQEQAYWPHRRYPLPLIQQAHGGTTLFEHIFNYTHFHAYGDLFGASDSLIEERGGFEHSNYPFVVQAGQSPDGQALYFVLELDSAVFSDEQMQRMVSVYDSVLQQLLLNVHGPYDQTLHVPQGDIEQLQLWSGQHNTSSVTPLLTALQQAVNDHPQDIALHDDTINITYEQLNRQANQVAHWLCQQGIQYGDRVGISLPRSTDLVVALIGILKAGATYVPLDLSYPQERRQYMVDDSQVRLILDQQQTDLNVQCLIYSHDAFAHYPQHAPNIERSIHSAAYVMYTSGSTGNPKGVVVSDSGIVRLVKDTNYVHLSHNDVFLQHSPVSFDASTFEIWGALLNGAQLVLAPQGQITVDALAQQIQQYNVSVLWLTAPLFHVVVDEDLDALNGVHTLLAGGDILSPGHVQRYLEHANGVLINGYGPTEATTFSACCVLSDWTLQDGRVPIGSAIQQSTTWVLDDRAQLVPLGAAGELCVGGLGVAQGYWGQARLTAERFIPDANGTPGSRLYRTGDQVCYRHDGRLDFQGRRDHQVKVRGYRIELAEVERVLRSHHGIEDAVALVHETQSGHKQLVAYVVGHTHNIEQTLNDALPKPMHPSVIMSLDTLPLTVNGKVDRNALPKPQTDDNNDTYQAPQGNTEQRLAQIWAEVLDVDNISRLDNYFELGGDSIMSIQIVARAQDQGLTFGLDDLFEHESLAELAKAIEANLTKPNEVTRPAAFELVDRADLDFLKNIA